VSQPEDGGSNALRNVGIVPHHYTMSQPEDGGSKVLRNVGILPHGIATEKTINHIFTVVKTSILAPYASIPPLQ